MSNQESHRPDSRRGLGGIVHTYQKYNPVEFPSPTQPPPDMVSSAFDHMLMFGERRPLSEEELARAVRLDPSQIQGLGPSIDMLMAILLERKRKILSTYEVRTVERKAGKVFRREAGRIKPPRQDRDLYQRAVSQQQIYLLERLWYQQRDEQSTFARQLLPLMEHLSNKYEIDELAAKYEFTGHEGMTIPQAIEIKKELEKIDELLEQLKQARETAQIAVIDMEALAEFAEPQDMEKLQELEQMVANHIREMAEQQGLESQDGAYNLTPQAYRTFQSKLLERIFSELEASRSGRHTGEIQGDGAVEMAKTRPYEFGDSVAHLDIPQTLINAMLREHEDTTANQDQTSSQGRGLRISNRDMVVHETRNNPKCATVVIMDMSGSMRYDGQYMNVKRMALALDGLIHREFPGDYLRFIEMYSFAKLRPRGEIINLMPKPVTITDPWVRLKADMSDPEISEYQIHPHFTNIQHSLQMARQLLAAQDTPNRQIILITDGLPTAHFEGSSLYLLYPPDPATEAATMREGMLCQREGITINMFLVPSWSQSEEDIRFAHRLAESTTGRVFFTAGGDLDRYVVWDYVQQRRDIL